MTRALHLYYHSSCFDGIVSSVIAADFIEKQGWKLDQLIPVSYDVRARWLSSDLRTPCAVVDFLYHPQALFWADHHATTFLSAEAREDFEQRRGPWRVYDDRIGSCALLLHKHLAACFDFTVARYDEMVEWADKIDSARYSSVEEAILDDAPALRLRSSLAAENGGEFSKLVISELRSRPLSEVAELPVVKERSDQVRLKIRSGLASLEPAVQLVKGEIVVFDVSPPAGVMISRYAPYHFFPTARYSVGVVRSPEGAKITAMRNPWRDFPSVHLGKIFENLAKEFQNVGGGGHQRVASAILPGDQIPQTRVILAHIVRRIQEQDEIVEAPA